LSGGDGVACATFWNVLSEIASERYARPYNRPLTAWWRSMSRRQPWATESDSCCVTKLICFLSVTDSVMERCSFPLSVSSHGKQRQSELGHARDDGYGRVAAMIIFHCFIIGSEPCTRASIQKHSRIHRLLVPACCSTLAAVTLRRGWCVCVCVCVCVCLPPLDLVFTSSLICPSALSSLPSIVALGEKCQSNLPFSATAPSQGTHLCRTLRAAPSSWPYPLSSDGVTASRPWLRPCLREGSLQIHSCRNPTCPPQSWRLR
jgi:hypothetical protein